MSIISKSRLLYAAVAAMLGMQKYSGSMEALGRPTAPSPRRSRRHKQVRRNFTNSKNHFRLRSGTGLRERNRRVKQIFAKSMPHAVHVANGRLQGEGALIRRGKDIDTVMIQADNRHFAEAFGWHESPARNWAVN